jgi:predicted aconitase with swiveling domain
MGKKSFAAILIAIAAVFAMPLAANAAGYVPAANVTVTDSTPAPGQTVTVNFANGSYTGGSTSGEDVNVGVTGNGTATVAIVKAATVTITKAASATGSLSVAVTLPANATGTYTLTATGVTSGNVGTAVLTVTAADAGGLAATGADFPFLMVWTAGGALLLGVALLLVLTVVRRQRAVSAR